MRARLSGMMFLQFFAWGAWYVTVGNYMMKAGMGSAVTWAYSVAPVAAILSPFILGMVADRFFAIERVMAVLHIVGSLILACAPRIESPGPFIGILFLHTLCYMPTLGLSSTIAFNHIVDQEKQFPLIRVFGSVGWVASNILVSKILHADETVLPLQIAAASGIVLGLYSLTLPHTPPPAKGRAISVRDILGLDALALLRNRSFFVFIVSSTLLCIPLATYQAFGPIFLNESGLTDPAFKMSFGQISEIIFMLTIPFFFRHLGVKKMFLLGLAAWVVRFSLFVLAAPTALFWMIMVGIVLHGFCYNFFFITGQIYVDRVVPAYLRGQVQGLLVLVTQGIGMLIGAQLAGRLFVHLVEDNPAGWQVFWAIPGVATALGMVLFALLFKVQANVITTADNNV